MSANRKGAVKKWMGHSGAFRRVLAYLAAAWAILAGMEEPADREETGGRALLAGTTCPVQIYRRPEVGS